jgi:hypothetical protein
MHEQTSTTDRAAAALLWLLPLLAGLLPAIGVAIAFPLAVSEGQFPPCNPLIDGCVSISRAGRHGLPNTLFRAFLLPGAILQGITWWLCRPWLTAIGAPPARVQRWLPWLGLGVACFLVLYGAFLGTQGFQSLRRVGVIFYFGCTCIGMVIVAGTVHRTAALTGHHRRAARWLLLLFLALPTVGLLNTLSPLAIADAVKLDHFENATEWWGAGIFTVFFVLLAALWRQTGYRARLTVERP